MDPFSPQRRTIHDYLSSASAVLLMTISLRRLALQQSSSSVGRDAEALDESGAAMFQATALTVTQALFRLWYAALEADRLQL